MKKTFRLGDKATDAMSGLTGILWSRVEYLASETQYGIMLPPDNGKPGEVYYVDETRLVATSVRELQEMKGEE